MIRFLLALLFLGQIAQAACTKITMPTDFAVVTNGTRANLKANFTEIETKVEPCMDSVDEIRGRFSGYTGSLLMSSLENLRLKLDSDASTTGLFLLENGSGDSLFRVSEDSTWRAFGAGRVTKLTTSDTVVGAHLKTGGTLAVTGLAALASRVNIGGVTDNASFALNVAGGAIATRSLNPFQAYGSGVPGDTDYERASLIHTGSATELRSQANGTGTVEPLRLVVGSTTRYEITNAGVHAVTGDVDISSTLDVTGAATAASMALGGNEAMTYDEGQYTATLTGVTTTVTGTAYYSRAGKIVTVQIPQLEGTSNSTDCTLTGLPASLFPTRIHDIHGGEGRDNGANWYNLRTRIGTDGIMTLGLYKTSGVGYTVGNFTNTGTKGVTGHTITYTLQ